MQSNQNKYISAAIPHSSATTTSASLSSMQNANQYVMPPTYQYSTSPAPAGVIENGCFLVGMPYGAGVATSSNVISESSYSPLQNSVIVSEGEFEAVRKQTDRKWLVGFASFVLFCLFFIFFFALREGDPSRIYRGVNYQGLVCGSDKAVAKLPFLYVPLDPRENYPTLMLRDARCVESCFTEQDVEAGKAVHVSIRDSSKDSDLTSAITMEFKLLSPVYATFVVANAYCIPKSPALRIQINSLVRSLSSQLLHAIGSFRSAWAIVLSCLVLAVVLSLSYSLLLRIHAAFAFALMAVFAVVICFMSALYLVYHAVAAIFYEYKAELFYLDYTSAIFAGLFMLLLSVVLTLTLFLSRRGILTTVKTLDCTGSTIFDMPSIIIAPTIFTAVVIIFFFFWIFGLMYISTCGVVDNTIYSMNLQRNGDVGIVPLHRPILWNSTNLFYGICWWILLFWMLEFLIAFCHFVLAYAGTVWYFSPPEGGEYRDVGWCPPLVALSLGFIYHSGSFALGGIVMGSTRLVRLFFGWAATHKTFLLQHSAIIFNLRHCFKGVITPISYIVDRFTSSGYIEMSVSSRPFFPAMEKSLNRILNSRSAAAQLYGVCAYASAIGTIGISTTVGLICYSTLTGFHQYSALESDYFVSSPLFVSFMTSVIAGVIAALYLSLWDVIADTLMYCFLVESVQPPVVDECPLGKLYAPPCLREFLLEVFEESQMQPYAFQ